MASDGGETGPRVLVIGCGNLLRGDDGVGPILVRHLWERGIPPGAQIVDGGTAGMDVAFRMRGARRVVLVDAARTGAEPGTVYRVPGPAVAELPPLAGMNAHSFRWDHALAFAHWLLKDDYPDDVTIFLIEAACLDPGAELSAPVRRGMERVIGILEAEFLAPLGGPEPDRRVEFTADGHLHLAPRLVARHFPSGAAAAIRRGGELWLIPRPDGPARPGELPLHPGTPDGGHRIAVRDALDGLVPTGARTAIWDDAHGALRIPLTPEGRPA
ncbi:peptidase M52 [Thermopolyspora flexuosa]|uniref:Hydrogenase maturation protease n=1 Tax=Thermopolyspora flexuosa TaxID=103836 RepID=A0A543IY04_9ACTN|nr:hydrogenase maturation protease [Thermopolyspora flexuosa]TQM75453.1 hydrogenase maturation protease [Thermopolyspora flexuosa]GGM59513.1 peptidase M52 [Thermopolyspora flexuosa]